MRELHGIPDATKHQGRPGESSMQKVEVRDGIGEVLLILSTSPSPAGLTPEQANYIASLLEKSADRVVKQGKD